MSETAKPESPEMIDRVLVEVLVAAPIDTVFKALRERDEIRRWFGWEYAGFEDELTWIVSTGQVVTETEEGRVIKIPSMNDRFVLQPLDANRTVLRVIRSAPAAGPDGKGWKASTTTRSKAGRSSCRRCA